jgi:hypothetical protein
MDFLDDVMDVASVLSPVSAVTELIHDSADPAPAPEYPAPGGTPDVGALMNAFGGYAEDAVGTSARSDLFGVAEGAFNLAKPFLSTISKDPHVPVVSNMISAAQAAYEFGSAGYDAATGDRDGAVYHGTKGAAQLAGAIPLVSEGFGVANQVLAPGGNLIKAIGNATGNKSLATAPPTSVSDFAGKQAVMLTNAVLGEDRTPGTGTRRGEVGAGIQFLLNPAAAITDGLMGGKVNRWVGDEAGDLLDIDPKARTSGHEPSEWAKSGRTVHDVWNPPTLATDDPAPVVDRDDPVLRPIPTPCVPTVSFDDLPRPRQPWVPTVQFQDLPPAPQPWVPTVQFQDLPPAPPQPEVPTVQFEDLPRAPSH